MRTLLASILITLLALTLCSPVSAAEEGLPGEFFTKGSPIEISADSLVYDKENQTYEAAGSVVLVQERTTLRSDRASLNMATGLAEATGNVLLVDEGGNTMRGESLSFNVKTKEVLVRNARLFYKDDNVYITGEEIRKTGERRYASKKVSYTTCDCEEGETPDWRFTASSVKVTVGEYLTGRNAYFYVKKVPVLYSPYIRVPVKRGRQTGFLTPRPGYSRLRGFVFDNAFYWAISKSQDATFYLDLENRRGLGKGIEYRYYRTRRSFGEAYFYHFKEKDIDRVRTFRPDDGNLSRPMTAEDDRWRAKLDHTEHLPWGVRLHADIDVVSDDEYLLDFGKTSEEKSVESLESNVSVSKSWGLYSMVAQFRVFDNLLLEDDSTTLRKVPEVTFNAFDQKIPSSPFYFSGFASFINFRRDIGTKGQRLDLKPRLSLPINAWGYFDFTPSAAPRATMYKVENHPAGRYIDRYLYELNADLTTTFVRVYRPGLSRIEAVKHTLRPKIEYVYIPEVQQEELPQFDAVDNIPATNRVTYSLNSTLTGRYFEEGRKSYMNYLYMELAQSYDINEGTRDLLPGEKRKPFSPVTAEVILRPTWWSRATGRASYNVYEGWYDSYDAELNLTDGRGDAINLSHRFQRESIEYLEGSLKVVLTRALTFNFLKRFSFDEDRSIETTVGFDYASQCWTTHLIYSRRLEETGVYLTFDLLGLGRVAGLSGTIERESGEN